MHEKMRLKAGYWHKIMQAEMTTKELNRNNTIQNKITNSNDKVEDIRLTKKKRKSVNSILNNRSPTCYMHESIVRRTASL